MKYQWFGGIVYWRMIRPEVRTYREGERASHENFSVYSREGGDQFGLREQEPAGILLKACKGLPH